MEVVWKPGASLKETEKKVIRLALRHYKNRDETAVALGISRRTLDTRISELRVENEEGEFIPMNGSGLAARYNPKMDTRYLDEQRELKEKAKNGKNPPAN